MFNPKDEVPDLELCEKLQELGYPQETGGWYWLISTGFKGNPKHTICFLENFDSATYIPYPYRYIKAPTVRELGERLPSSIKKDRGLLYGKMLNGTYFCGAYKKEITFTEVTADKEANARAKMLIWLVENKYIEF